MSVDPIYLSVKLIPGVDDRLIEWSNSAPRKGINKSAVVKIDLLAGIIRRDGKDSYEEMIVSRLDRIEAMLKKLSNGIVEPIQVRETYSDPLLDAEL